MDIVDTFNHLIPSDQLDDSMVIGQNLECEASNEFGSGLDHLEDSLMNMLSDKDPMFGSASSQFNLLDNEDTHFQIPASTVAGLDVGTTESGVGSTGGELTSPETPRVKRPVGRPRKNARTVNYEQSDGQGSINTKSPGRKAGPWRSMNRQQRSFLIEKGVQGPQQKKELALGGRINIHDLDVGPWLNPVVVLRRLTVTVGGFRIELLPGPSYAGSADAGQLICFEDGLSYGGDLEYAMVQDDVVDVQSPTAESIRDLGVVEKCCTDDLPLSLGPYVNPNDVQAANGTLMGSLSLAESKGNDKSVSVKHKPVSAGKDGVKKRQYVRNKFTTSNKIGGKELNVLAKKHLKSKQGLTSVRNKNLVSSKPSSTMRGPKAAQHVPSKPLKRGGAHNMKVLKEKKGLVSLKRHGENAQTEHPAKVQRLQDGGTSKPKPKSLGTSSSPVKKVPDNRLGEEQRPPKPDQPHPGPKPDGAAHPAQGTPGPTLPSKRPPDEAGQEKFKLKKLEKLLQRQKSRNSRSISVEEPQLFVPDNAPVVKKEAAEEQAAEEQPANSETVWDGSNNCGLCKKNHNNMFMVGCGRCDDWFHGDCVGLDLTKVREMEEEDQMYVCLKCCSEESAKAEPEAEPEERPKPELLQDSNLAPKPRQGPSQPLTSGGVRPMRKDSERRQSTDVKDAAQKTGVQPKQETKSKISSPPSKKPVSVEDIRRSVRDSLKEILLQRLMESDLKVLPEKASEVAKKTERELFHLYKDTDSKYKNKYRSLMFNLKDTKNNVLFKRVLRGEIFPTHLVRMSPEELASKELAAWRQRENRHTIEMIEKEQREVERRPITKITHKGEIEIESQEPAKAPETNEVVLEPALQVPEDPLELLALEKKSDSTKVDKDTTSLHKSHLFDLHCKICTGRMAPPMEEAPTKVVKVATTVVRRQSSTAEESKNTPPPPVKDEDLHLSVLEESLLKAKVSSSYEGRSDYLSGREDEAAFLSNLKSLWRGFINMPAVAKLVTKVFPVSGSLDSLTEDLPDSVQVGGRISPQIVWDYLEKIRATGTKEVCLIRFSPETEEDEISYTLLYAYFSSRKRFGVVANNRKQIKDMYIIPLGSTEKVPHQLVPFDGPGLENNRSNLLLGLIIRQRPKRDFLPMDLNETARFTPETKPLPVSTNATQVKSEDENFYLNKLTAAHTKEKENLLNTTEDADEPVTESLEDAYVSEETNAQEPKKPLRFLPGVLVGWGGKLPPLPDFSGKPIPAADPRLKTQQALKADAVTPGNSTKSSSAALHRDRFVIKKREPKPVKIEPASSNPPETSLASNPLGKDGAAVANPGASVSLKDKPETSMANNLSGKDGTAAANPGASVSLKDKPETSMANNLLGKDGSAAANPGASVSLKDEPETSMASNLSGNSNAVATNPSAFVSLKDKPETSMASNPSGKDSAATANPGATVSLKDKPETSMASNPSGKDSAETTNPGATVSLKDKPETSMASSPSVKDSAAATNPGATVSLKDKSETSMASNPSEKDSAAAGNPGASASLKDKPETSMASHLSGKDSAVAANPGASVSLKDKPETSMASNPSGKDSAEAANPGASVSLKDKPPDMSTEDFLASLSSTPATGSEDNGTVSADKGEEAALASEMEKGNPEENSPKLPKSEAGSDPTTSSKPPLSQILKKSSAYASGTEEKKTEAAPAGNASSLASHMNPQPVPVVSSIRNDPTPASQRGFSQLPHAEYGPGEAIRSAISSSYGERADPNMSQAGLTGTQIPSIQGGPQAVPYAPLHTEAPRFQYQAPVAPAYSNAAPFPPQQQPQVPGNYGYPCIPPPAMFLPPHPQGQNHGALWGLDGPTSSPHMLAGLPLQYRDSYSESSNAPPASSAKDYNKGPDDLYSDPWDRPRPTGDRDHHGQHRPHSREPHHGKKSRHHSRERGKKHERSGHEDKYRSRHHGHSKEDRHGERRKERHHSDDHGSRHKDKDRHRHRRDSDYEKGRRSSKDSYS